MREIKTKDQTLQCLELSKQAILSSNDLFILRLKLPDLPLTSTPGFLNYCNECLKQSESKKESPYDLAVAEVQFAGKTLHFCRKLV